jgi:hypothetical protein
LRENQDENFVQGFVWSLGGLLCTYLHPPSKADEVSCESWQFVTAIHYEGLQALLQFQSQQSAMHARSTLQGRNIYDGCSP